MLTTSSLISDKEGTCTTHLCLCREYLKQFHACEGCISSVKWDRAWVKFLTFPLLAIRVPHTRSRKNRVNFLSWALKARGRKHAFFSAILNGNVLERRKTVLHWRIRPCASVNWALKRKEIEDWSTERKPRTENSEMCTSSFKH